MDGRTDRETLCWHRTDGPTDGRTDENIMLASHGRTDRREHYVGTAPTDGRTDGRTDENIMLAPHGRTDGRTDEHYVGIARTDGRTDKATLFCFLQLPPLFNVKEIVSIESKL